MHPCACSPYVSVLFFRPTVQFNKSVSVDAAKVCPGNVTCTTVHSLAFKEVGVANRKNYTLVSSGVKVRETIRPHDGSARVSYRRLGHNRSSFRFRYLSSE